MTKRHYTRIEKIDKLNIEYGNLYNQTQLLITQADILSNDVNSKYLLAKQNPTKYNVSNYKAALKNYNNLKKQIVRNQNKLVTLEYRCLLEKQKLVYS